MMNGARCDSYIYKTKRQQTREVRGNDVGSTGFKAYINVKIYGLRIGSEPPKQRLTYPLLCCKCS